MNVPGNNTTEKLFFKDSGSLGKGVDTREVIIGETCDG
jgi:hypothetical protein